MRPVFTTTATATAARLAALMLVGAIVLAMLAYELAHGPAPDVAPAEWLWLGSLELQAPQHVPEPAAALREASDAEAVRHGA